MRKFLCDGQITIPAQLLKKTFKEACELREFASYGPRVTYRGEKPFVGPCHHTPDQVKRLVEQLPAIFMEAMNAAGPRTAYAGNLAPIVIDSATKLLVDAQFPFSGWFAPAILRRAKRCLRNLTPKKKPVKEEGTADE
jgi:hypothetical protein